MRAASIVAHSLDSAYKLRATATSLLLSSSPELRCVNLMCEKVGYGCACRLALTVSRMPALLELDVSHCALDSLPESVWGCGTLTRLIANGNLLTHLPDNAAHMPRSLIELDVRDNVLAAVPWKALAALPSLRSLRVSGNAALLPAAIEEGVALLAPRVRIW